MAQQTPLARGVMCKHSNVQGIKRSGDAAFSLLEIITVLAFITMVTAVIVGSYVNIVMAMDEKPIERVFREMVREARIKAATTKKRVYLSFDQNRNEFFLTQSSGEVIEDELEAVEFDEDGYEVLFFPKLAKQSGLNRFNRDFAEKPVEYLIFHPSGTSTPALILFRYDGEETHVTLDSFSSGSIPSRTL